MSGDAYQLIREHDKKLLVVAKKMGLSRKSNYHMFDMTRGVVGSTLNLTKKLLRNTSRKLTSTA